MVLAENSFLKWLMSGDGDRAGVPELHWANLPESWGVFVLIAAVVAIGFFVFWLYSREIETCPKPIRIFLGVLRFAVLLLLVLLFLKPSVTFKNVRTSKPVIAILRDGSSSFGRKDKYQNPDQVKKLAQATGLNEQKFLDGQVSRAEIVQAILEKNNGELLTAMREKATLKFMDYAEVAKTVALIPAINDDERDTDKPAEEEPTTAMESTDPTPRSDRVPELKPTGRGTDLWQALHEALNDTNRLAAIVLIGDGQHNGSQSPVDQARKGGRV